jgi:hypothetical protein
MWLSEYDFWFFCRFYKVKNGIWKAIAALRIDLYLPFINAFKALVTSSSVYEGIGKEEES